MGAIAARLVGAVVLLLVVLQSANANASPSITTPAPGSTLSSDSLSLSWEAGDATALGWWVYAGSTEGGKQYLDSGGLSATTTSYVVSGLPEDGSTIHIRLWYRLSSGWASVDGSYVANLDTTIVKPAMTSPTAGSQLSANQQLFKWSANTTSVDEWWLYVGSVKGGRQYHDSGSITPSSTLQKQVNGLPTDDSTVHVRLWYRKQGQKWFFVDSSYKAKSGPSPELISPAAGTVLSPSGEQTITWRTNGVAIDKWWVYAGSTVGGKQYYDSGGIAAANTSTDVPNIPTDGSDVHIRFWYKVPNVGWKFKDYSYTAHLSESVDLSDYDLVFSDEFNGTAVDSTKWNSGLLWGPYVTINNEEQVYIDKLGMHSNHAYNPFEMTGSSLKITATEVSSTYQAPEMPAADDPVWNEYLEYRPGEDYDPASVNYLSGILTSYESFQFTRGYVEARVKFPAGQGLWPAFWLLNAYYVEDSPEIDIVEFLGQNTSETYHTYHYFDIENDWAKISTPTFEVDNPTATSQFHTYGVSWEAGQIIWYVDGIERHRVTAEDYEISKQSMYVLLNMAVGGTWPGSPDASTNFPAEYEIDYVRAYQKKPIAPITQAVLQDEYQLMFSDEFSGTSLDPTKWNTAFLWGPYLPINNEEQYYVDSLGSDSDKSYSPFDVSAGTLKINAEKASENPGTVAQTLPGINDPIWTDYSSYQRNLDYTPPAYTSGLITSYDAFKFVNGYAEARAKIPAGDGLWPAFWLLNGYYVGPQPEIDVVEFRGENPVNAVHSYHYSNNIGEAVSTSDSTDSSNPPLGYADDFHTYAVSWEPGEIVWYIDGAPVHTVTDENVSTQLMYVLANLAVGGDFNTVATDPSAIPAAFELDYVRVYQRKDSE